MTRRGRRWARVVAWLVEAVVTVAAVLAAPAALTLAVRTGLAGDWRAAGEGTCVAAVAALVGAGLALSRGRRWRRTRAHGGWGEDDTRRAARPVRRDGHDWKRVA